MPQQTYLLDDTIKNNIAFGQNEKEREIYEKIIELVELEKLLKNT